VIPWLNAFLFSISKTRKLLLSALFIALLALSVQLNSGVRVLAQSAAKSDSFKPLTNIPAQAEQVETGIGSALKGRLEE
jgi:hypothetical protein